MKKTKKYTIVDLTDVKNSNDVYAKFAEAKVSTGNALTKVEFYAAKTQTMVDVLDALCGDVTIVIEKKKPNIFKRAWNFVKKLFKK